MFHGSMVALVTPMSKDRTIDYTSLSELIEWHIANQTDALVVLGTTGESATINFDERDAILKAVVNQAADRIPIIAGTGSNSTEEAIALTKHAMEVGVDACLLVTPYYNKPTQEGLYQHFRTIADTVVIPQILYNVPGRTGCDLLPRTLARLTETANIIGIKDATGDIARVQTVLELCGDRIDQYSGDDATAFDFIVAGGKGVISVTANVAPHHMHEMCSALLADDYERAKNIQEQLMPLHQALFVESNPIPVKWALQSMGKIAGGIRLPLTTLANCYHEVVQTALLQAGVIDAAPLVRK